MFKVVRTSPSHAKQPLGSGPASVTRFTTVGYRRAVARLQINHSLFQLLTIQFAKSVDQLTVVDLLILVVVGC